GPAYPADTTPRPHSVLSVQTALARILHLLRPRRDALRRSAPIPRSACYGRIAQAAHRPLPAAVKRSGDTVHPVSPPPLGRPAASLLPPHPDEMLVEKRNRFDTA